ncbi:MAG: choice-of-anchor D domain-containing protein [Proteobacteria bacterium]|nr:choice-of-anchor D domain-containing protein [Pseudomonadota bacterium]
MNNKTLASIACILSLFITATLVHADDTVSNVQNSSYHDDDEDEDGLAVCATSNLKGKARGWCESYCGDHQCGTLGGTVPSDSKATVPGKVCSLLLAKLKAYLGQSADYPCNTVKQTITLSPSLSFPNTQFGVSSAPQTVILTNVSSTLFSVIPSSITITGTQASAFSQTNNCSSLAPGASCSINVVFTPQVPSPLPPAGTIVSSLATLSVSNGQSILASVSLDGKATAEPQVSVSPASIDMTVTSDNGSGSVFSQITISNSANATSNLLISSIQITGSVFSKDSNCDSAVIPPGGSCIFNVNFAPTGQSVVVQTYTGSITINDNSPTTPETVSLTGASHCVLCLLR